MWRIVFPQQHLKLSGGYSHCWRAADGWLVADVGDTSLCWPGVDSDRGDLRPGSSPVISVSVSLLVSLYHVSHWTVITCELQWLAGTSVSSVSSDGGQRSKSPPLTTLLTVSHSVDRGCSSAGHCEAALIRYCHLLLSWVTLLTLLTLLSQRDMRLPPALSPLSPLSPPTNNNTYSLVEISIMST